MHKTVGNKAAVMRGLPHIYGLAHVFRFKRLKADRTHICYHGEFSEGELIQSDATGGDIEGLLVNYCHKTYFKTAALIAHGCKGIGLYGRDSEKCFEFGKHLGMAFQYIDDVLDFVGDEKMLGKSKLE